MDAYKRAKEYSKGDMVWIEVGLGQSISGEVCGEDPRWEGIAIMPSDAFNAIYVDADKILESAEHGPLQPDQQSPATRPGETR